MAYPCDKGRSLKRHDTEDVEKPQESEVEKGNPTKEGVQTQLTICNKLKEEKLGDSRKEIKYGESEEEDSTTKENLEDIEEEEDEEENWLDKEPRSPIVQEWSNPLYNPDPPQIYYSEAYDTNYLISEDSSKGST